MTPDVVIVPANEASCADLDAVFGTRGYAASCRCQRFKIRGRDWDLEWTKPGPAPTSFPVEERARRQRAQTQCGHPDSETTSGLIAYLDGEPAGWCAVEPRTAYIRLRGKPLVWTGRAEDKDDDTVWAVTCLDHACGLSAARHQPRPRPRGRRFRSRTRRAGARGLPDDHGAGTGRPMGRAPRR